MAGRGDSKGWRRALVILWVSLPVLAADQLSKFLVRANMFLGQSIPDEGLVRLTYTTNKGGVFGFFANQTLFLTLTTVIVILVILLYLRYLPIESRLLKIGLGLQLGGGIGNQVDRTHFGEVTDFLDFGSWPVFNLADSAIVVGTFLLAWFLVSTARKRGERT